MKPRDWTQSEINWPEDLLRVKERVSRSLSVGTPGKISHGTAGRFATRRKEENVCFFARFEVLVDSMVGDSLVGKTNLAYSCRWLFVVDAGWYWTNLPYNDYVKYFTSTKCQNF